MWFSSGCDVLKEMSDQRIERLQKRVDELQEQVRRDKVRNLTPENYRATIDAWMTLVRFGQLDLHTARYLSGIPELGLQT